MTTPLAFVGIDTGGTFTDFVAFIDGQVRTHKVLSTPSDPAVAVLRGLREVLPENTSQRVTYASTVATNTLLERRGARVVLLTTAGFEDVIEIGRQNRPALYDLEPCPPEPLVPRGRRIGVAERVLYDGHVLVPLKPGALRAAARGGAPSEARGRRRVSPAFVRQRRARAADRRRAGEAIGRVVLAVA